MRILLTVMAAAALSSIARTGSAQEDFKKSSAGHGVRATTHSHRAATGQHAAARPSAPYAVHGGVGAGPSSAGTASQAIAPTGASPGSAPGAMVFHNGRALSTGGQRGLGTTPRVLRAVSHTSSQNPQTPAATGSAGPGTMTHGYGATAAASSGGAGAAPARIGPGPGTHALSGPGVGQGQPDTPAGGQGGGAKDPLSSILDGLAGMFKDMANMLGGGKGNGG